jgi:hypothetical protein
MNATEVQRQLVEHGIVTTRLASTEQLDNRSLECGCRPYLCPDMNRSLLANAKDNDES